MYIALQGIKDWFMILTNGILLIGCVKAAQKIALADIESLTFHQDRMTTGQRSLPIKQLECTGGNAQGLYSPTSVTCKNLGGHGKDDLSWSCKGDFPIEFKFGSTDVQCEGWHSAEDNEYILDGSCGLAYTMYLTEEGEKVYQQSEAPETIGHKVFKAIFLVILGVIVFNIIRAWRNPEAPATDSSAAPRHGPGHDGDDNNNDDPPVDRGSRRLPLMMAGATGLAAGSAMYRSRQTSEQKYTPPPSYSSTTRSSTGFGSTSTR